MSAGPHERLEVVEAYWQQLRAVDDRLLRRARANEARRRLRRTLTIAVLALLLLAAAAFAARALLFGDDAPKRFPTLEQSLGGIAPGSARVLAVREEDPDGGPPWGLRIFRNRTGNMVCVSAGRVVNGQLVALGVAGAFGGDGRAHRLPIEAEFCGRASLANAIVPAVPRSAYDNELAEPGSGCLLGYERRALDTRVERAREEMREARASGDAVAEEGARRVLERALRNLADPPSVCGRLDVRSLVYGFAGPTAVAVTVDGVEHALDARGHNAYLFVLSGERPLGPESIVVRLNSGVSCQLANPLRPGPADTTPECVEARGKP